MGLFWKLKAVALAAALTTCSVVSAEVSGGLLNCPNCSTEQMQNLAAGTQYFGQIVVYNVPRNSILQFHRSCDRELGPCGPTNTFTESVPVDAEVQSVFAAYRTFWEVSGGSMQKEVLVDSSDLGLAPTGTGTHDTVYDLWNINYRGQLLNRLRPGAGGDISGLSVENQLAFTSLGQILNSFLRLGSAEVFFVVRFNDGSTVRIRATTDGSVEIVPHTMLTPGGQIVPTNSELNSPEGAGEWTRLSEPTQADFDRMIDRFIRAGIEVTRGGGSRIMKCSWNGRTNRVTCSVT